MPRIPRGRPAIERTPAAKVRPQAQFEFAVCPLCCLGRPVEKIGSRAMIEHKELPFIKGRVRFDSFDIDNSFFIQVRERRSEGKGFPTVGGLTLEEAKSQYLDLVEQIKARCQELLDRL